MTKPKKKFAPMNLQDLKLEAVEALESLKCRVFLPGVRDEYKMTLIARHPGSNELDILITEDDPDSLLALIERRYRR